MINLLADERKDEIRAARVNVILLRYIAIVTMGVLFLLGILFVSYKILENTQASANATIQSNDVKADVYSETKAQVDALSAKLSESKVILNQEVRYSKVLTTLGQIMPAGTVLGLVTLNESSFNGAPVELKVYAKANDGAATIRDHLQASPLFSQVSLKGTDSTNGIDGYPITVTLSVIFNRAGVR